MKRVVTAWEAVARITLAYLPIMAANSLFIGVCDQERFRLPEMQDQKSLTLRWRSFWRWGRERVSFSFAYKGRQRFDYVYSLPCPVFITRLTGPKIVDTPLTLILKMGQGACCILFCLYRMPTHWLCVFTTKSRFYYPTYRTKNRWRSIDGHFEDGVGSVFLTLLPIKDANTLIMCIHYQVAFLLPDLQDQKSLTLRWCSFSRWGRERVAFFFPYTGCQNF